ncbi:amidohydrolase family protein [Klenkia taihuensis]|uniref:L-fuconolactonase n=1 Tax=Klenkia taihuensis TaxID=1225127 RepID=A0A1I1U983_9ACTN|nr:amidohydrolase family protein [Klenkia taihuensis]GHE06955.1 amidohydrolase [Klenkia taihuensis]SFD65303.1 L-fuconolactonase [Klenkia taihuensis]
MSGTDPDAAQALPLLDTHAHIWSRARTPQPWIEPATMAPLDRDFDVTDLAAAQRAAGITEGAVLVQSAHDPAETGDLLAAVDGLVVRGVVGWVDLRADLDLQLESWGPDARHLVGVRHLAHQDPDPWALLADERRRSFAALAGHELPVDLVLRPEQLRPVGVELARRHPGTLLVLDHLGNPPLADEQAFAGWRRALAEFAAHPNTTVKLSGIALHAADHADPESMRDAVDHALGCFGAERTMFGSDWPVVELAGGARTWTSTVRALTQQLSRSERRAVFSEVGRRIYRLGGRRAAP